MLALEPKKYTIFQVAGNNATDQYSTQNYVSNC